eukprot:GILI01027288.1.p1 GENE.GILI01027288.1~~GILI01027288.1.p1  ORF type:complete len:201 (+),score=33.53 GILI01027288.1:35-637(+)
MAPKKATKTTQKKDSPKKEARKQKVTAPKKATASKPMLQKAAPKPGALPAAAYAKSIYPADTKKNYWLIKSEPFKWSWSQQCNVKQEHWDGVRNYQANNNMKAMRIGDLAFYYHSNEGKDIVGVVRCVKEHYPDHTDDTGKGFGMVDFSAVATFPKTVTLATIKSTSALSDMALVRQGRLSVCEVMPKEWDLICKMGGMN